MSNGLAARNNLNPLYSEFNLRDDFNFVESFLFLFLFGCDHHPQDLGFVLWNVNQFHVKVTIRSAKKSA